LDSHYPESAFFSQCSPAGVKLAERNPGVTLNAKIHFGFYGNPTTMGIHWNRDILAVSVGCVLRTNARGVLLDRPRCVERILQICPALSW